MRHVVALVLAGLMMSSVSQGMFAQTSIERGPDGGVRTFVAGIEVPPIPNSPFSGTDTIVRTRTVDGGSIISSEISKVVRDSQGRVYRERHHFGPANADPQKSLYAFYVLDPMRRTRTECVVTSRHCTITNYRPQLAYHLRPAGPFDEGKQFLTRETLGQQSMENLNVVGTKETITVSPGTVGNDHPLTLTREFWYSSELGTNVAVTRTDPREGTDVIRLSILSRSEPELSVFDTPSGYVVEDLRLRTKPLSSGVIVR